MSRVMSNPSSPAFQYPFTITLAATSAVSGCRLVRRGFEFSFQLRSISRAEYTRWRALHPTAAGVEDEILRHAVLAHPAEFQGVPWDWEEVWAGIASQVIEKVLTLSGFGSRPDPELIARVGAYLDGEEARYDLLLLTAFNYTLEQIMALDAESWHRLVGLAEAKLAVIGVDPQRILDPEGSQNKRKKPLAHVLPGEGTVGGHPYAGPGTQSEGAFMFTSD